MEKQMFNGWEWRILKTYCQGRAETVPYSEAKEILRGYYPDLKAAFNHMWAGGRCETAGHVYWIEKARVIQKEKTSGE